MPWDPFRPFWAPFVARAGERSNKSSLGVGVGVGVGAMPFACETDAWTMRSDGFFSFLHRALAASVFFSDVLLQYLHSFRSLFCVIQLPVVRQNSSTSGQDMGTRFSIQTWSFGTRH